MSIKKNFVDFFMKIMADDKSKANVNFLLYNETYPFMYDMKTTELGQFSDLEIFHFDNFQVCTSITVEVEL